jgi:hypothetical protein
MNLKEREGLTKLTSEGWGVLKEEIVKEVRTHINK